VNIVRSLELMEKYSTCLECGSMNVGNGEGTLNIEDDSFKRTCKCGWEVTIRDERQNHHK
jgi:hypothetical protein